MPIRITGLTSGLDTEAIISALVSSYNYKTNKYKKAQTKLSWKQDAWKTLNTKIYSLYSSVGSMKLSTAYNLKSTTVSDSTKATVKAGNNAPTGTQQLNILKVAQAGYLTGAQLSSKTTTSTTLAELGYTGGDAKINLTKGDGTTKEITVTQGSTVGDVIASLKDAGVSANFDETNHRIFISSKDTGKDNDFTLTGANTEGARALYQMGLAVGSDATNATYKSYTQYYDANDTKLEQNVVKAIQKYQDAQKAYKTASGQNANLSSAYGYATAYTEMMDALKNSGLSADDQKKLKTLLGMSATQRVNSVMDAAGNVYTEAGKDADGNTIYAYDNNGTKQYIQKVVTYQGSDNLTYTANDDGTYTDKDGHVWTATGDKDDDGNAKYSYISDDGTTQTISIKENVAYYNATGTSHKIGDKYTDKNGVVYTPNDNGTYAGTDGKNYILDGTTFKEVDSDKNVVISPHLVPICFYIGEIWDDDINARHITVWKCQTAIQNEYIVAAFKHGHILSDFVQAAQWNDPNRCPANFLLMIGAALCSGKRCCTGHRLSTASCLLCRLFATVLLWRSPPIISLLRQCCCLSFFSFFRSQIKNLSFCSQMRQKVILHKDAQFPFCCVIVCAISIIGYIRYK